MAVSRFYVRAKHDRERWTELYNEYAKDPKKAKSTALAAKMRELIKILGELEQMG
jgi:protein-disulfide isomerase